VELLEGNTHGLRDLDVVGSAEQALLEGRRGPFDLGSLESQGPGEGVEAADLGDHFDEILVVDAANLAQGGEIALGDERQMRDHRLHGRIVTIQLAQLQRQTFGEIARANASRLKGLDDFDDALDARNGGAELGGKGLGVLAQIAGLVDGVDDRQADHPIDRIVDRQSQLFFYVTRFCRAKGGKIFPEFLTKQRYGFVKALLHLLVSFVAVSIGLDELALLTA